MEKRERPPQSEEPHKPIHSTDFVALETYEDLFEASELQGKTIINLGSGYHYGDRPDVAPSIQALKEKGATILPFDVDFEKVKSWQGEGDTGIVGNALELPLKPNSVDGVVAANFFNAPEVSDQRKVATILKKVADALKENGFLLVTSFGYAYVDVSGGRIYSNDIPAQRIIGQEKFRAIALDSGFKNFQSLELDAEKIKEAIPHVAKDLLSDLKAETLLSNVKDSGFKEAFAALLTK